MGTFPFIAVTVALLLVVFLGVFIFVYRRKGEMPETDYRALFIIGVTWLPLGIAIDNPGFLGVGLVFMLVGLANRDKWKEGKKWAEFSASERNTKLLIILGLAVTIVLAAVLYFLVIPR